LLLVQVEEQSAFAAPKRALPEQNGSTRGEESIEEGQSMSGQIWCLVNIPTRLTCVMQGGNSEERDASKKPRRSQRLSQSQQQTTPVSKKQHLPSPITHDASTSSSDAYKEATATPPEGRPSQIQHHPFDQSSVIDGPGLSSPPQDTQAFSQFAYPATGLSDEVKDEAEEGVWGYLLPMDQKYGKSLVLRKRNACPIIPGMANFGKDTPKAGKGKDFAKEEDAYEQTKFQGVASGGYLIGRHPECGRLFEFAVGI
jgi:serine/threonine-protein kinase CHEK2